MMQRWFRVTLYITKLTLILNIYPKRSGRYEMHTQTHKSMKILQCHGRTNTYKRKITLHTTQERKLKINWDNTLIISCAAEEELAMLSKYDTCLFLLYIMLISLWNLRRCFLTLARLAIESQIALRYFVQQFV